MNIYANISGKTCYFKSREEADEVLGKKPAAGNGKKPNESKGNK